MKHRSVEHLLSLGIGLVALGMGIGLALFLVALFGGAPMQTTLNLAFDGMGGHTVTLRDTGAAVGNVVADHGTLTVRAGWLAYLLGQGLDIMLGGGLLLLILYRLRRLVIAIAGGQPFAPGTVAALRTIGWSLIALNLWAWISALVLPLLLVPHLTLGNDWRLLPAISFTASGAHVARVDAHLSIVLLLVGVVVLVLAEAFRAGQALREDSEAIV